MKIILTFIAIIILLAGFKWFQNHPSSVIRGELVVDSIVPINDSGSFVYFQPKQFGNFYYVKHAYYNRDLHFKVGDTLGIECDTITKRWTTSITELRGQGSVRKMQVEMQRKAHEGTVMMYGFEWSQ